MGYHSIALPETWGGPLAGGRIPSMEQTKDQELQVQIEGRNYAKDWYSWEFWDDSQLKAQFKEMKKCSVSSLYT